MAIEFPFRRWTLTNAFKAVEVELVEEMKWGCAPGWFRNAERRIFHRDKLHETREQAIAAGFKELERQEAALEKKRLGINKRRAALEKASHG